MANFYEDNADLRWYVEKGIDWEPLVRYTEYDWRAEGGFRSVAEAVPFYQDLLSAIGQYAAEGIAPRARELDLAHPRMVDGEVAEAPVVQEVMAGLRELGVHGLCLPRELGGMNAPLLLLQVQGELIARADVSTCTHVGFHGGMALAALMYSVMEGSTVFAQDPPRITETRFRACIEEIVAGAAWGSMDLTEAHAGSDMAALRCRGEMEAEGNWFVTGQKVFITSGHGRWHFVIARTEPEAQGDAFAGLGGLSMFLVPAWSFGPDGEKVRHASVIGVEEKLGHNASATCTVQFERAPAHLIGRRGEGFKLMLLLMNNARVGVGFEAIGVMEAARRAARAYAAQRPSMGKTIDRHEMIAELLDAMDTDTRAARALGMAAAWHEELAQKLRILLKHLPMDDARRAELEREQKRHARKSRHLTPLLKWFASEKAVEHARAAIQVHGGAGYIREYGVEKLLRDAMVFPIYEGTSQIQALMVMKDNLLEVVRDPGRFARRAAQARWRSLSAGDPLARRAAGLRVTANQALQFLVSRLATAKVGELRGIGPAEWKRVFASWDPKRDFALAMLHAERLTGLLCDAAVADVLWDQAEKDPERRELLEAWLEAAEPRSRHRHDVIVHTGARLLAKLAAEPAGSAAAAAK